MRASLANMILHGINLLARSFSIFACMDGWHVCIVLFITFLQVFATKMLNQNQKRKRKHVPGSLLLFLSLSLSTFFFFSCLFFF